MYKMELVERIPLRKINFLNEMDFKTFKTLTPSCKNDDDRKVKYDMMKSYCQTNIKTRGETKRIYSYTQTTPLEVGGRLYSGNSIQGLQKDFRGFLLRDITTDIDMKNAHPVILKYICKIHNISCPNLSWYVDNRDTVLEEFGAEGKTEFLKAVNDDKINRKIKHQFFKDFDKECKMLQKKITELECYKHIVDSVPSTRMYNWLGSAINRILCVFENKILQSVISICNKKQIEICALMFDGLMIYGDHYENAELLNDITNYVNSQFEGLNMIFAFKEHSQLIQIIEPIFEPKFIKRTTVLDNDYCCEKQELAFYKSRYTDCEEAEIWDSSNCVNCHKHWEQKYWVIKNPNYVEEIKEEMSLEKSFEKIAEDFELTHCKIINKGIFIKEDADKITPMSRAHLLTAYENLTYEKIVETKKGFDIVIDNFINTWLKNNPSQRCYDDIECFPDSSKCPDNILNCWKPFAMELVKDYTPMPEALKFIRNHILILCNNEIEVANYFEAWIGQMIQYPDVKSICPTLISKEGAGKGTLMMLLQKMIGDSKYFETSTPSRDVWGDFNGRMANTFLVNLDELSKKETMECEGKIKALITNPKMTINNKGINQYGIMSFHRFIATTNNEDPIKTSNGDRRNLIIRSSDELKGNVEYFNKMYKLLDDVNVIKTCYEYFKTMPDMDKFKELKMPETTYQNDMKEASVSPVEAWLKSYIIENYYETEIELIDKDQYNLFKEWCKKCGLEYNLSSIQFGVRLNRLNLQGLQKGKHTKKGNTRIFNISKLKEEFKLLDLVVEDN